MAEKKIHLEIITPTAKVFTGEVDEVIAPAISGYFGVLPGHAPYMVALGIGEIQAITEKKTDLFATSGGFAEVLPDKVTLLASAAESAKNINTQRAQAAADRAKERLDEGRKNWDIDRAVVALTRAMNRIKVSSKA